MGLVRPLGDARHSTSATIADRRFRAAIVVLRSLWRDPRPDGEPSHFNIAYRRRVSRLPARRLSYRPQRRRRGGLRHAGARLVARSRSRSIISCLCILTRPPGGSCFRLRTAPAASAFFWMRWIRESVSTLLPVAGVGGDVVGARLVHQRGVSGAQATASMVVDITVGSATQLVFVLVGVGLLTAGKTHDAAADSMGAYDRRRHVRGGDRSVRPAPTQQHVWHH